MNGLLNYAQSMKPKPKKSLEDKSPRPLLTKPVDCFSLHFIPKGALEPCSESEKVRSAKLNLALNG